jgi:hypothetical protein
MRRFADGWTISVRSIRVACRHLTIASTHRILRSQAFDAWKTAAAASA